MDQRKAKHTQDTTTQNREANGSRPVGSPVTRRPPASQGQGCNPAPPRSGRRRKVVCDRICLYLPTSVELSPLGAKVWYLFTPLYFGKHSIFCPVYDPSGVSKALNIYIPPLKSDFGRLGTTVPPPSTFMGLWEGGKEGDSQLACLVSHFLGPNRPEPPPTSQGGI